MDILTLTTIERFYKNNGQEAERRFRYTYTGRLEKADNRPATECADCDDIQIKSARATICKGTDLDAYLATDKAQRYAYVIADFSVAYIMTKALYREFAQQFATVTTDSSTKEPKLRFKHESKALLQWLKERV